MMERHSLRTALVSLLVGALAASFGCGGGGTATTKDAGGDAKDGGGGGAGGSGGAGGGGGMGGAGGTGGGVDAAPDTRTDGGTDTGGDVAGDAPRDTSSDAGSDTVVDAGPPPTMLTATILDRRQTSIRLAWPAPSNGGQPVNGYQIRYANVPITAANFDTAGVTTQVTYTGTPSAPGAADGITVSNLFIENDYYFAVAGTATGSSTLIGLMTTTAATRASFLVSLLPAQGTPPNQFFGATIDGSADVNGDGLSDLAVGTTTDTHAYLYLGAAGFAPTAPSVTFTGATSGFGAAVRFIGDIDHDGRQDIAIADQGNNRVLIYRGRATWPAAMTDAVGTATGPDFAITTDATWAGTAFGLTMAPLGDFDNDGSDDFVIGASAYAAGTPPTRVGRVAVIYGRAGFTSVALPDATRSLEIAGDGALNRSQFGLALVGLGHFYTTTPGTTLVVSAPGLGNATSTSDNEGRLYAFHGRGPGAAIAATSADHVRVGAMKAARIGQTLVNLGPIVNTLPALGCGNNGDSVTVAGSPGTAYVLSGAATSGPFANLLVLIQSGGSGVGQVMFGGGFSGRDATVSLIGDSTPDLAMTAQSTGTATPVALDIFDGAKVAGLTGPVDATTKADVHVPMPAGWSGAALGLSNLIKDIDGDGHPDFALGDQFMTSQGRVVVFR
jgi:hypothetical protein